MEIIVNPPDVTNGRIYAESKKMVEQSTMIVGEATRNESDAPPVGQVKQISPKSASGSLKNIVLTESPDSSTKDNLETLEFSNKVSSRGGLKTERQKYTESEKETLTKPQATVRFKSPHTH